MPHGVDPTKLPCTQVTDDRMSEILVQMQKVLNISNTRQALSESHHTHVNGPVGWYRPVLQKPIEVPNFAKQQADEVIAVVPEDIWNLACRGCRDPGDSLFKCSYLTTVHRIVFAYRYFRHHAEANPLVAKWYTE